MPAVAYHCSAKVISRSAGQSSVAAAAYRTGLKLNDERYGKTQDYTRKEGVEFVWHATPQGAPEWAQEIGSAWNAVEQRENRKNSTLAREYVAAFPHQLTAEQREWMLKDFVREEFTRKSLMATAVIHAPSKDGDERNYHAHIMVCERPFDEGEWAKHKDRSLTSYAERERTLDHAREKWADLGARQLERAGYGVEAARWQYGHLTLQEQTAQAEARGDWEYAKAIEGREGTKHLGVAATAIERSGKDSDRGNINRELIEQRAEVTALDLELQAVHRQMLAVLQEPERAKETIAETTGQEQNQTLTIVTPEREVEPTDSELFEDWPSLEDVGEHLEDGADAIGKVGTRGLGAALKAVEVLALGVEEIFFGGASRQAKGGAEYEGPEIPKPMSKESDKPLWQQRIERREQAEIHVASQDAHGSNNFRADLEMTKAELVDEFRRREEAAARKKRERDERDYDRER